jgi:hypothetical protein
MRTRGWFHSSGESVVNESVVNEVIAGLVQELVAERGRRAGLFGPSKRREARRDEQLPSGEGPPSHASAAPAQGAQQTTGQRRTLHRYSFRARHPLPLASRLALARCLLR